MAILWTTRREFLRISATAGGGLLVGFSLNSTRDAEAQTTDTTTEIAPPEFELNAWLTINADNTVTVRVASAEMGQGIMTGIAMMVAEELDADWETVTAEFAPAAKEYYNPLMGRQATGGSTATRGFWQPVREAGAVAREMLVEAAAARWSVLPNNCRIENGAIYHDASKRKLTYGEIAAAAAERDVPLTVFLKEPDEFTIIGTAKPRLDTPAKIDGSAVFASDIQLPGMMTAVIAKAPVYGATVEKFSGKKAMKIKGVKKVAQVSSGVAVIATSFWDAKKGRDALNVEWDRGANAELDSEEIFNRFAEALDAKRDLDVRSEGNIDNGLGKAAKTLDVTYTVPYQAHACMEPMCAVADVSEDGCDIHVGTQAQTVSQQTAMRLTGLPESKVRIHSTFLGGGFGRRSEQDFITDAVECAQAAGKPVKVLWTREDDMVHDVFRPASLNRMRGGIDSNGRITTWEHRIAGDSILATRNPKIMEKGSDGTSTMGASDIPYNFINSRISYAMVVPGVPCGFWRSVGSSQNAYVTECFFDELAALAGRDPLLARLQLLDENSRHAGVLKLAAEKADWGKPPPAGRARGIAVAKSFASWVAQVAEVSIDRGRVRVHRVTCAVDCGIVVNPDSVRAQMEGAVVYGLTAALKSEITIKDGLAAENNFDSFPLLRIDECPAVDVHFVENTEKPGGVGEPGVPPIAPAVANAVFKLTGKPVRSLPIRL